MVVVGFPLCLHTSVWMTSSICFHWTDCGNCQQLFKLLCRSGTLCSFPTKRRRLHVHS
jgi:hypothetical protein